MSIIQVQVYEFERVERKCRELEQQLERQKEYYERNFLPVEQLDEFKKELETKVKIVFLKQYTSRPFYMNQWKFFGYNEYQIPYYMKLTPGGI